MSWNIIVKPKRLSIEFIRCIRRGIYFQGQVVSVKEKLQLVNTSAEIKRFGIFILPSISEDTRYRNQMTLGENGNSILNQTKKKIIFL